MTDSPGLMTTKQAAAYLGISLQYTYRLTTEKKLPYVRIGSGKRFHKADLDAWIDAKRVPAI